MAKEIDLEIKSIVGEITEVNSRNEQKVVAIASWNGREDTIDIRKYNPVDEMLLKGISLTPEEAGELIYILLGSSDVVYDRDRVREILQEQEELDVDVQKLVSELPNADEEEEVNVAQLIAEDEEAGENTYTAAANRNPYKGAGQLRVTPKKNGLFKAMYN